MSYEIINASTIAMIILAVVVRIIRRNIVQKRERAKLKEEQEKIFKYEIAVSQFSRKLQALRKINNEIRFFDIQREYIWSETVNSRHKCENFNFDSFLNKNIINRDKEIHSIIYKANSNQDNYTQYRYSIQKIAGLTSHDVAQRYNIPTNEFLRIETQLFNKEQVVPITDPIFTCNVAYISSRGLSRLENRRSYDISDLLHHQYLIEEYKQNQSSQEYQRRYERNRMSDSLRYDILKRDGFRCKLCGRSANDGIKLHVDHIIPVSKGGKTISSNLRTLCSQCNLGKRDKYDPHTVN